MRFVCALMLVQYSYQEGRIDYADYSLLPLMRVGVGSVTAKLSGRTNRFQVYAVSMDIAACWSN